MTNEEKAREIASLITSVYGVDIKQETHAYSAAIQAMEWKDSQYKATFDKLLIKIAKYNRLDAMLTASGLYNISNRDAKLYIVSLIQNKDNKQ
jgi:hypothetical protein